MRLAFSLLGIVVATLLTVAMLFTPGWVRPPIISTQTGYRGTGQEQLISAQNKRILEAANALPAPIDKASPSGERATSAYKNVKVLTDLSTDEFNRLSRSAREGYFPVGKLVDRDEPDFNARYEVIRDRATAGKG